MIKQITPAEYQEVGISRRDHKLGQVMEVWGSNNSLLQRDPKKMLALQREAFGCVASQLNNHQHGSPRTANVPHEHWHTDGCGSLSQSCPSLARRSLHLRPVQDVFLAFIDLGTFEGSF